MLQHLLERVLELNPQFSETFIYKLFLQQLRCLVAPDARSWRWDKDIIHWCLTLQYHGGKATIDALRGKGNQGLGQHGCLTVDPAQFCLFIPADSTLRSYLPPVIPQRKLTTEDFGKFKAALSGCSRFGFLAFDEIEIRGGLMFLKRTQSVIGLVDGAVSAKKIDLWTGKDPAFIQSHIGTKIMQFFYISADGRAALPLDYVLTKGITPSQLVARVTDHILAFRDIGISILATSSDGFTGQPLRSADSTPLSWLGTCVRLHSHG
jgi:hypothetical protein